MEPAGGRPSRIEFGRQWLCDKRQTFMSPGTDTSIQKNKMASAQWPNGAGQAPSRHSRGNSSRSPHRIQPSKPGPGPLAKIFQRSVQFVNCRQRAPIGTPVRKEGQARNREIALEPAEILSTRRLRLVANWQQTLVLALFSPLRRCCRYSFARTAPDSPLTQQRSPPPLSTDVPFRAPLPALGSSRRPRHP